MRKSVSYTTKNTTFTHTKCTALTNVLDAISNDGDDDLVGDEATGIHDRLALLADVGALAHSGTEHVAGGELRDLQLFDNLRGLGALASAGGAEEDQDLTPLLVALLRGGEVVEQESSEHAAGHLGEASNRTERAPRRSSERRGARVCQARANRPKRGGSGQLTRASLSIEDMVERGG